MKKILILLSITSVLLAGFTGYLYYKQIKNDNLKDYYISQVDECKKELAGQKKENNNLAKQISALKKSNTQNNYSDILDSMLTPAEAPTQQNEIKKISDCQDRVREKYYQLRLDECKKMGYEKSGMDFIRDMPDGCILPDSKHQEFYKKEITEGKACGDNYFFISY